MSLRTLFFAAAAGILAAGPSLAQPAPRAAAAAPASSLDIRGFRSAYFGETQAQVKAAINNDFPGAKIEEGPVPTEGTYVIIANVPQIEPGPGPAVVTYGFGANSKTLFSINIIWTLAGEPTVAQRQTVQDAATRLTAYFQSQPAPVKYLPQPQATGPNGALVYAGVDKKNSMIQVAVDGVQTTPASPPARGPATLRLSYVLNADTPDTRPVAPLKPGSF